MVNATLFLHISGKRQESRLLTYLPSSAARERWWSRNLGRQAFDPPEGDKATQTQNNTESRRERRNDERIRG